MCTFIRLRRGGSASTFLRFNWGCWLWSLLRFPSGLLVVDFLIFTLGLLVVGLPPFCLLGLLVVHLLLFPLGLLVVAPPLCFPLWLLVANVFPSSAGAHCCQPSCFFHWGLWLSAFFHFNWGWPFSTFRRFRWGCSLSNFLRLPLGLLVVNPPPLQLGLLVVRLCHFPPELCVVNLPPFQLVPGGCQPSSVFRWPPRCRPSACSGAYPASPALEMPLRLKQRAWKAWWRFASRLPLGFWSARALLIHEAYRRARLPAQRHLPWMRARPARC